MNDLDFPKTNFNSEEKKLLLEKIEQLQDLLEDKNNTINNLVNELVQCNDKIIKLEEKNKEYEEINIKLEQKIKELENVFEVKNKSFNDLLNKIVELDGKNNELLKKNSKNNFENEEISKLKMKLDLKEEAIIESYKKLFEKEKIIERLNLKLLNYPFELLPEEKIISINFISFDESINYSMICKNTDNFSLIENKLYEKLPEYKNLEIYFMIKGKEINKYKNLDENGIHNNDIITMYIK